MTLSDVLIQVPIPPELWLATVGIILLVAMAETAGLPGRYAGLTAFVLGVLIAGVYMWSVTALPLKQVVGLALLYGLLAPVLHKNVVDPGKNMLADILSGLIGRRTIDIPDVPPPEIPPWRIGGSSTTNVGGSPPPPVSNPWRLGDPPPRPPQPRG